MKPQGGFPGENRALTGTYDPDMQVTQVNGVAHVSRNVTKVTSVMPFHLDDWIFD